MCFHIYSWQFPSERNAVKTDKSGGLTSLHQNADNVKDVFEMGMLPSSPMEGPGIPAHIRPPATQKDEATHQEQDTATQPASKSACTGPPPLAYSIRSRLRFWFPGEGSSSEQVADILCISLIDYVGDAQ